MFRCSPTDVCPEVLLDSKVDVTAVGLNGDVSYEPLGSTRRVSPYVAIGAGAARYRYSWDAPAMLVGGGARAENVPVLNAGLGASVKLADSAMYFEVTDRWSPRGDGADLGRTVPDGTDAGVELTRKAQHRLAIWLGWRVWRW